MKYLIGLGLCAVMGLLAGCASKPPDVLRLMPAYTPVEADTSATFGVTEAWCMRMDGSHFHGGPCSFGKLKTVCVSADLLREEMRKTGFKEIKWGEGENGEHVRPNWVLRPLYVWTFYEPYNGKLAYYTRLLVQVRKPGEVDYKEQYTSADDVRKRMVYEQSYYINEHGLSGTEQSTMLMNQLTSSTRYTHADSKSYAQVLSVPEKPRVFSALSVQIIEAEEVYRFEKIDELDLAGVKLAMKNLMNNPEFRKALVITPPAAAEASSTEKAEVPSAEATPSTPPPVAE